MNRQGIYVYFNNPNKVHGPFVDTNVAIAYANPKMGTVTRLTGNDILAYRIRVTAPHRAG